MDPPDHALSQSPSFYHLYLSNQLQPTPADYPSTAPNGHDSFLSPQEREIMADITLDPDDPTTWSSPDNDASLLNKDATSNILHSKSPSVIPVSQHLLRASPAIAPSTSTSISPSPFAPPVSTAESHDVGPVRAAISADDGDEDGSSEYVMEHLLALFRQDGEPGPGDASEGGQDANPSADRAPFQQNPLPPLDTINLPSSSRSHESPRHLPKTPLFLPSPSESSSSSPLPFDPPSGRGRDSELQDVISIHSSASSSSSLPPSRPRHYRTRNQSKAKPKRQLMAYVLVPPLPSWVRKAEHVPIEQVRSTRKRHTPPSGKARAGDNSGPSALAAALQGAFENNSSGAMSTQTSDARRRKEERKEGMRVEPVVVDDGDEREGRALDRGSSTLARALSNAFAHNSADPNVAVSPVTRSSGKKRRLRRTVTVEIIRDSKGVDNYLTTPLKRTRAQLRARAVSDDRDPSSALAASRRREEEHRPQTPTTPLKKRRRLARRGHVMNELEQEDEQEDEGEGEIEIVDSPPRELRRSPRTKPPLDPSTPKLSRPRHQPLASIPSPVSISASTSSSVPEAPQSPLASSPDTSSLADQPLTILPAPPPSDIVIPPRALTHLHTSPDPPNSESILRAGGEGTGESVAQTQHMPLQDFQGEEAAVGAHGLLESPIAVAATLAAATSPELQNHPLDLGLDVIVPMDINDGEQEQMQERQDMVRPAVVPPHALRISSSTHPDGPMLGFVLSEHEEPVHANLSADPDTDASSDGVGLENGFKTGFNTDLILASLNPGFGAGAVWLDWSVTGVNTTVVAEGEYAGDGTIDPSVLNSSCGIIASPGAGSPGKIFGSNAVSEDCNSPIRSSVFVRANTNLDMGGDGDVVPLFNDAVFDTFVSPPSTGSTGGKGRGKAEPGGRPIRANNTRIRRKSWRKTLADENKQHEDADTDTIETRDDRNFDAMRPTLSSLTLLLNAETTFCHHCRRKTRRPKMRCTRIKEKTGVPCGKMYCDLCIEKRYPGLTFDEFATVFLCPYCGNFCNCTQCSRARGEEYVPERNGGWRKWAGWTSAAAAGVATAGPTSSISSSHPQLKKPRRGAVDLSKPARKGRGAKTGVPSTMAKAIVEAPAPALEKWSSNVFTVTGEPLGEAFMEGNKTRVLPLQSARSLPSKPTCRRTLPAARRRYVYIGKRLRAWGRLVSVPDPEGQQPRKNAKTRRTGRGRGKRKRAVRVRVFAGSEEPLLLAARAARKRMSMKRKYRGSSAPLPSSSPARGGGNFTTDGHADGDAEEGVRPGENVVSAGVAVPIEIKRARSRRGWRKS
ncbi:hypothetical protein F5148DRAFT_1236421 [Russula earlei]|uniref:Uncharacterized protein n=1 Tax=Russula earlei TaxID=71964 RepID=A0ACC0TYP0_9AGAM|nr:hypothetical protein F5148DRAFT_1236421 [Russula earlei]